MTELDEMWDALEKHQFRADKRGHGESWAEMCRLRTEKACTAASKAAYADAVVAVDAVCGWFAAAAAAAAYAAAGYAEAAANAEYWRQEAIYLINKATGEIK